MGVVMCVPGQFDGCKGLINMRDKNFRLLN